MSEIIPFAYEGQPVRVAEIDGAPWFVASDVAKVLGYSEASAMTRTLEDDEKGLQIMQTLGGEQKLQIVSESGLYSAILRSHVEGAKTFKRWVTHEVLPSIRKHGAYMTPEVIEQTLTSPDFIIKLATALKEEQAARVREVKAREAAESLVMELEPKADAFDAFIDTDGTYSIGTVAKALGLSQNKLFTLLRNAHILISKGAMRNTPYQKYVHHFAVKMSRYERTDGTSGSSYTPRVQPSGVEFIRRKLGLTLVRPLPELGLVAA